jgi:hypothetical protein
MHTPYTPFFTIFLQLYREKDVTPVTGITSALDQWLTRVTPGVTATRPLAWFFQKWDMPIYRLVGRRDAQDLTCRRPGERAPALQPFLCFTLGISGGVSFGPFVRARSMCCAESKGIVGFVCTRVRHGGFASCWKMSNRSSGLGGILRNSGSVGIRNAYPLHPLFVKKGV